ncbi:MAG: EamA family transporter [Pelolinea sp.]|nr:EamA family transporter [Pelolinea sp.]
MSEDTYSQRNFTNRGYAAAVGSALFLSLTAIFIRYLTQNFTIPALVLAFWREIFVASTLFLVFALLKPERLGGVKGHLLYLVGYGLVLAIFNALWTFSVTLNGAAVATVLAYSSAGFTVLLGWLILKEELTFVKVLVVGLSLMGCALIVNAFDPTVWSLNNEGVVVGMATGLLYAIYSIMGRSAAQRGLNTWTTLFYIFAFASLFMLSFNLLFGGLISGTAAKPADLFWLGNAWLGWVMLLALAIGPTLMGFGLYNVSLRYLPSSTANLVVMIEPVFTALVAFFLFGEILTPVQILGGGLILASVGLTRIK